MTSVPIDNLFDGDTIELTFCGDATLAGVFFRDADGAYGIVTPLGVAVPFLQNEAHIRRLALSDAACEYVLDVSESGRTRP